MDRIIIKFIVIVLVMLVFLAAFKLDSLAVDSGLLDIMQDVTQYNQEDVNSNAARTLNSGIGIIQYAGSGIAIIAVSILGIKYVLASPSDKADVKREIFPMLIGAILLFGAVNVVSLILKFTNGATGAT